jgi:hypothetical protein
VAYFGNLKIIIKYNVVNQNKKIYMCHSLLQVPVNGTGCALDKFVNIIIHLNKDPTVEVSNATKSLPGTLLSFEETCRERKIITFFGMQKI